MKTSKLTTILALFFVLFASTEVVKEKQKNFQNVSSVLNVMEETLKLENWMVNDNFWEPKKESHLALDVEKSLKLEPWMTDMAAWESAALLPVEYEKPLSLESWMTNNNYWDKEEVQFAANHESGLK